jgi:hypothetical protein
MAEDNHSSTLIKLLVTPRRDQHVSQDAPREFEANILASGRATAVRADDLARSLLRRSCWSLYRAWSPSMPGDRPLPLVPRSAGRGHYLAILMGPQLYKCLPYFGFARRKSIYFFDSWPGSHAEIQRFADHFSVNDLMFSSSQVAESFQRRNRTRRCHWIPEGIDPDQYRAVDYDEKDIGVLQIGRRYDAYHDLIAAPLETHGVRYLYEAVKGQLVFHSREEFIDGLARAKISICTPAAVTHPERAGNVSTMTIRYLQSMVSKCLVVGVTPPEMERLFDYKPILEIDMADPVGQLRHILTNFRSFIPLIEKNYEFVRQSHTWAKRWETMLALLEVDRQPRSP